MENSAFALEETLAVYGIRKNPFPIDEVDGYFFSSPNLGKQLKVLRNLVDYGELLLVISGLEGAGKTAFLRRFLLVADKRWQCCEIFANGSMTINSLVHDLLTGFGLRAHDDDAQADETLLRAHLASIRAAGDVALVAVDDAHLLPQICTEFLLGLAERRVDMELRLLLTTEPGRLGVSTNDSKHVHVVVLKPFDAPQCGDYLNTRLSNAGLVGDSPFNDSVVDNIHQDSGGLPGAMHPLALHTLLAKSDVSQLRRRAPVSRRAIVYVTLALVIAAAAALFMRPDPDFRQRVSNDTGTTGTVKGRILTGTPTEAAADVAGARTQELPDAAPEPVSDTTTETFAASVVAKVTAEETQNREAKVNVTKSGEINVLKLDKGSASTAAARAVTRPAPVKGEPGGGDSEAKVSLASNVTPAALTERAKAPPAQVRSQVPTDYGLEWLRGQKPSHFVIQLVGTRSAAAASKFVDKHKLGADGAWYLTSHGGQPWYVVIYGMYPDSASARAAIGTLPEALRAGSPWPRSVTSILESAR